MAGTTIDKLPDDLGISIGYANRILLIEEMKRRTDETRVADVVTVTTQPVYTDLDILLGTVQHANSYASFNAPEGFFDIRRNPFTTFSVGPSFGSLKDRELAEEKLLATPCTTTEEIAEKNTLNSCLGVMNKIGEWIAYISGRKGQFLQG